MIAGRSSGQDSGQSLHRSVLLDQAVDLLVVQPRGHFIDGTFGRGGHSRLILKRLEGDGRLIGIDKDPEAVRFGEALAAEDGRFVVYHGSFAEMDDAASGQGWEAGAVTGVLLDLGVSSPQLDDAERGFSFMSNGPLDMRMDTSRGPSAAEWLNTAAEKEIADVIWRFGEERFSRRIARAVVQQRVEEPLATTREFAELVRKAVPKKDKHKHPATRSFQAVRIFINRELKTWNWAWKRPCNYWRRVADRIVKRFMRDLSRGPQLPRGLPVRAEEVEPPYRTVGKALKASEPEIQENVRARSAVMRVLERRADDKGVASE